jgi:hypothetical protein
MAEEIVFKVKLEGSNADLKRSAKSFSEEVADGLRKAVSGLGIGGAAKGAESTGIGSGAISSGVAAGLAAGGVVALIQLIADALKDMPIITGIMKILKIILMLLFMPLIPILKPVLMSLGELAKGMSKELIPGTDAEKTGALVGGGIGATAGALVAGPVGAAIGMAIGAAIGNMLPNALKGLQNLWTIATSWADKLLSIFGIDMDAVRRAVVNFIYVTLPEFFTKTLPDFFKAAGASISVFFTTTLPEFFTKTLPAFFSDAAAAVGDFAKSIWGYIKAFFVGVIDVSKDVWTWIKTFFVGTVRLLSDVWDFIKSKFSGVVNVASQVWDWFKGLFKGTIDASNVWSFIKGLFKGESKNEDHSSPNPWSNPGSKSVKDFIITPQGTLHTDPSDFIIGTKNPKGMGGGMTVNITIDRPTLTGQNDIKTLVRAIEQELFKANRRYNSYV